MCTLSFHRHFNYGKSATRTRDSVTIISLTRASDWSLVLVLSSDWLVSLCHPWLRYHWHQDRSHPGTELLLLVTSLLISRRHPHPPSAETSAQAVFWAEADITTELIIHPAVCTLQSLWRYPWNAQANVILFDFCLHFTLRRFTDYSYWLLVWSALVGVACHRGVL